MLPCFKKKSAIVTVIAMLLTPSNDWSMYSSRDESVRFQDGLQSISLAVLREHNHSTSVASKKLIAIQSAEIEQDGKVLRLLPLLFHSLL